MPLRRSKAAWFLFLTFLISWGLFGLYKLLIGPWQNPHAFVLAIVYMFVPALSATIVQRGVFREPLGESLGIRFRWNRWFWIAWLSMPLAMLAVFGVSLLLPGVHYSAEMAGMFARFAGQVPPEQLAQMKAQAATLPVPILLLTFLQALLAGITVNAVAGFGEELGWRGLLYREWEGQGFWRLSGLTGLVWGIWHAPLILQGHNYPQHPVAGVFMMTAFCLLAAPVFTLVREQSGSVIAAAILHGTLNGSVGLALLHVVGGNDLLVGGTGLAGLIVLGLIDLGIWGYRRQLGLDDVAPGGLT